MANTTTSKNHDELVKLVMIGLLTAIVITLQLIGQVINFGVFAGAVALIPIIVGAILYGPSIGAWLGFVFGTVILLFPESFTTFLLSMNPAATIIIVLAKGSLAGAVSGLVFRLFDGLFKRLKLLKVHFPGGQRQQPVVVRFQIVSAACH